MKLRNHLATLSALVLGAALGSTQACSSTKVEAQTHADGADASAEPCPSPVAPAIVRIATYTDLMTALEAGERVRAVIHYERCLLDGKPGPNAVGGLAMDTFERFGERVIGNPKALVASSENHLIRLGADFVYNYARLSVKADDTATVDVQYLTPTTFAVTVDETFVCKLDDGSGAEAVSLFRVPR